MWRLCLLRAAALFAASCGLGVGLTHWPLPPPAGGLPTNWLGKQKPLRNVRYLDLSNNKLGTSDGVTAPTQTSDWCPEEGSLTDGSGWCPDLSGNKKPIAGTAASLVSLDLSNNGFTGEQGAASKGCGLQLSGTATHSCLQPYFSLFTYYLPPPERVSESVQPRFFLPPPSRCAGH